LYDLSFLVSLSNNLTFYNLFYININYDFLMEMLRWFPDGFIGACTLWLIIHKAPQGRVQLTISSSCYVSTSTGLSYMFFTNDKVIYLIFKFETTFHYLYIINKICTRVNVLGPKKHLLPCQKYQNFVTEYMTYLSDKFFLNVRKI
jgi:hypothetical protein